MPKLFTNIDEKLCVRAVLDCFSQKWQRGDILSFIEEWAGIDRAVFRKKAFEGSAELKMEAANTIGMALYDVIDDICAGRDLGDLIAPVKIETRIDGNSGKERHIATLDIWHQLIGHVTKLSLDKLFHVRIYPTQHASIPGRGQTRLKDQARRYLHRDSLQIRFIQKTDVRHAYESTKYQVLCDLIRKEVPRARKTLKLVAFLGKIAPEGHLIIGGYIDAWLFNYAMSYALREMYGYGHERRGIIILYVRRIETYMDDFGVMASTKSGLAKAVKKLNSWLDKNLHLNLKMSTGIIELDSCDIEKTKRKERKSSMRACPGLDMGGYVIHRTYITIRARVFLRARRQWLRAAREIKETGTMHLYRAQKIIAYNGFLEQSDSRKIKIKYRTEQLLAVAKKVVSFYGRLESKRREEAVNAAYKCYCNRKARCCYT